MVTRPKIRVLIVDDSIVTRELLARGISKDQNMEIVGTAGDPFEAKDKITALKPDVMTLDVEMPKMNGIEFLRQLLPQYPLPVIVVSSVTESVFDALYAGAVDFVAKSALINDRNELEFTELIAKIKIASTVKAGVYRPKEPVIPTGEHYKQVRTKADLSGRIIAIGASTGGTEAIASILKQFTNKIPGTLIVLHMPPGFTKMYAERLNNSCPMEVKEAQNGDKVVPGRVLIAPGNYHMRLNMENGEFYAECYQGEKINGHCPSINILFDSVAQYAGKAAIGIILTGMGADGAEGLLRMRQSGARTIGQDEESSVVYGMPKVAYEIGAVEKQTLLTNIPFMIQNLLYEHIDKKYH